MYKAIFFYFFFYFFQLFKAVQLQPRNRKGAEGQSEDKKEMRKGGETGKESRLV